MTTRRLLDRSIFDNQERVSHLSRTLGRDKINLPARLHYDWPAGEGQAWIFLSFGEKNLLSVKTIVKWDNRKFLKDILLRESRNVSLQTNLNGRKIGCNGNVFV